MRVVMRRMTSRHLLINYIPRSEQKLSLTQFDDHNDTVDVTIQPTSMSAFFPCPSYFLYSHVTHGLAPVQRESCSFLPRRYRDWALDEKRAVPCQHHLDKRTAEQVGALRMANTLTPSVRTWKGGVRSTTVLPPRTGSVVLIYRRVQPFSSVRTGVEEGELSCRGTVIRLCSALRNS